VTAAELMEMVRVLTGQTALTDAVLLQFLNLAQEDVSREIRAPTQTVMYTGIDAVGVLDWPSDAREDGILRVYALSLDEDGDVVSSQEIPVWDFNTASVYEPGWTLEQPADVARYIVWDPTAEVATPYPVPPPDSSHVQAYRINYVVRPTKMDALEDEPFNGRLESFHDILAYRAAYLLARDPVMLGEYNRRLTAARGASMNGIMVTKNPMYTRTVVRGGRG